MKHLILISLILPIFLLASCSGRSSKVKPSSPLEDAPLIHSVNYPGETINMISVWYTKAAKNSPEIAEANPNVDFRSLKIGNKIKIPRNLVTREEQMPSAFVSLFIKRTNQLQKKEPETLDSKSAEQNSSQPPNTEKSAEPKPEIPMFTNKDDPSAKRKQKILRQTRDELLNELGN